MHILFMGFLVALPFLGVSPLLKLFDIPAGAFLLVLTLVLAGCFLKVYGVRKTNYLMQHDSLLKILAAFCIINLCSLILAIHEERIPKIDAWNVIKLTYVFFAALTFLLVRYIVIATGRLEKVAMAWIFSATIYSAIGVVLLLASMLHVHWGIAQQWTVPRLVGLAGESQSIANYLVSALPLTLIVLFVPGLIFSDKVKFLFALIGLFALVITYSLGAWFGFAGGIGLALLLWLLVGRGKNNLRMLTQSCWLLLTIVIIFGAVEAFVYPNYIEGFKAITYKVIGPAPTSIADKVRGGEIHPVSAQGFETGFETRQTAVSTSIAAEDDVKYQTSTFSGVERVWFRQAAWRMFETSPLLGVGTGNFGLLYNSFRPSESIQVGFIARAHNQFLEILAETGIAGFAVFSAFIAIVVYRTLRVIASPAPYETRIVLIGLLAGFFAVLIQGGSYGFMVHIYFWVLAGILSAAGISTEEANRL